MATTMNVVQSRELYSSGDEQATKVRKPYTITKQRERWTEDEHKKFLEALKLYGRAWQRIEEHIGTKTAVQIRSHAQKFFTKVARETATNGAGSSNSIEIPPPRPKRKPMHPYPRKLANICKKGMPVFEQDNKPCLLDLSPMGSSAMISSVTQQDNRSPSSASSVTGRDLIEPNQMNCEVPVSPVAESSTHDRFGPANGFSSPSSSANLNFVGSFVSVHDNGFSSPDLKSKRSSWLDQPSTFSNVDSSTSNAKEENSEETDSGYAIKDPSTETSSMSLKLFGQTVLVNPASAITTKSRKSSFSTFQKECSLENFTSNEIFPIEKEAYGSCEPHASQEIESSDEAPIGSLQEEAWNLWSSTNPQMIYWLQYQQGDSDSKLDCISVAPWWALYGNFPFSFVQHLSLNDPSNGQGRDGVTLDVSSDPCHSKIHAFSNKKDKISPLSSEATSVCDNDTIEKGSSTGEERDEEPESSGLFSRKVSFRSSGTGFLPYKRCVAATNGENMQQFVQSGEAKRIRLCL